MQTPHVLYERDEAVAFVTINRAEARNAMTWEMYQALVDYCDVVERDPAVRVLVLKGAGGKAFIAGTDITEFQAFESREDGIGYERRLDLVIDRIEAVDKPTIAQVEGVATGGGCAIVAACDLRVCTPASRFGVPIARTLGNCLSVANHGRFLDLIGPTRLKELLYTARLIDADEALAGGLVNRVAEPDVIDTVVRDLAATIAENAPLTIKATKEMIRRIQAHRRLDASAGHDLIAMCYASDDFKEGVESFLAKRPPRWTGS